MDSVRAGQTFVLCDSLSDWLPTLSLELVEQEFLRNSYLGLSTNEDSKTVYFSLFSILQSLFIPELCSRLGHIGLEQEPIWETELCEFVVYWFDYSDSLSRKNTLTTRFITVFCDQHWSHLASSSSQLAHIITHNQYHRITYTATHQTCVSY